MDLNLLFLRIRNWAEIDEPGSPELANVVLPVPPAEAMAFVERVANSLPGWAVDERGQDSLHLIRRTRLFKFTDDIRLRLEAVPEGTRLHGRSASRVGLSDLGQNRRNLRGLIRALRKASDKSA
jgi:uncharacterized protein (DUF1499 family)